MMRFSRFVVSAVLLTVFAASPVAAQGTGAYPVEELGLLDPDNLEVDINLEGTAIQIAVGAMQDQDPRLVDLVSGLTRVRVQVGRAAKLDPSLAIQRINDAKAQLEAKGWNRMVQVEEGSESIYIYSMDSGGGRIAGITALVQEGAEEAVVVNIAGDLDPILLGSMLANMGEMDLSGFMLAKPDNG
jgi:hypothetical protein